MNKDTYGLRVTVIALAVHPLWRSEEGLKAGGPKAFGYVMFFELGVSIADFNLFFFEFFYSLQHDFEPVGEYREPRSVIEEYGRKH